MANVSFSKRIIVQKVILSSQKANIAHYFSLPMASNSYFNHACSTAV